MNRNTNTSINFVRNWEENSENCFLRHFFWSRSALKKILFRYVCLFSLVGPSKGPTHKSFYIKSLVAIYIIESNLGEKWFVCREVRNRCSGQPSGQGLLSRQWRSVCERTSGGVRPESEWQDWHWHRVCAHTLQCKWDRSRGDSGIGVGLPPICKLIILIRALNGTHGRC